MSRGRAYNIWKSKSKYVSRLNKNLYWWKVESGETYNRLGRLIPRFVTPKNWIELDNGNKYAKRYKKTTTLYKDPWKRVEKRLKNKQIRIEGKLIKGYEEEMQHEMPVLSKVS